MQLFTLLPIFFTIWLLSVFIKGLRNPLSHVPGPWYSKWTSIILTYHWLRGRQVVYVENLHKKYGKAVRISPNSVDFSSIKGAKQVHTFVRPLPKAKMDNVFRTPNGAASVFSTRDVDMHARYRRLLSSAMTETSLKSVEYVINERANLAMSRIGEEMKELGRADVLKWFLFFSTDIIGELTFGDSFRMLEQGKKNQYAQDLHAITETFALRIAFPRIVKMASYLPLPLFTKVMAAPMRMHSYAEESIRRYEKIVAADPYNPKPTLFTKIFTADGETMSRAEAVSNAQTYIIAGSDTTAHSLTYLTWAVCRDESIKQRLVKELQGLPEGYQDEELKALPYLNQVIQETLRLYPAVPDQLPRDVPSTGREIDGYFMPGGTEVQTQAYSMHRDPKVYLEPERFNPSRWETPSKEMKEAWMPFGGGARVCLGLHLAEMELCIATTKFFRAYPNAKVSPLDGFDDGDMDPIVHILMHPKNNRCLIQAS